MPFLLSVDRGDNTSTLSYQEALANVSTFDLRSPVDEDVAVFVRFGTESRLPKPALARPLGPFPSRRSNGPCPGAGRQSVVLMVGRKIVENEDAILHAGHYVRRQRNPKVSPSIGQDAYDPPGRRVPAGEDRSLRVRVGRSLCADVGMSDVSVVRTCR